MLVWNARFASRSNVGTRPGVGTTGDIMIRTGSNGDELHTNGSDENFSLEEHGDGLCSKME